MKNNFRNRFRKEYKMYVEKFKMNNDFNSIIKNTYNALELSFVAECHNYLMNNMDSEYELIKKLYKSAFIKGFNVYCDNNSTFYDYLIIYFKKWDTFDFQSWSCLTDFFFDILRVNELNQ